MRLPFKSSRECGTISFIPSLLLLFYSWEIFHTSVCWCDFHIKCFHAFISPGLFWVFWPVSIMLNSEWSQFFLWFPTVCIPFSILWKLFLTQQLQLVSVTLSYSSTLFLFHRNVLLFAGTAKFTTWCLVLDIVHDSEIRLHLNILENFMHLILFREHTI